MSIGNANLHQRGEIPEIVKLPNGRIRIIRRFHKFTREDVDNAALGSTMGNFGDLDTTGEQIANQGYTDCRLISVEVDTRFNSVSNADNAVLVKTYETLTSSFVQITDDTVTFTENGLRQVTRVYRAVSGTTSTNVIGTTNFSSGGTTVYLASSKLDDNDAFAELTETYIEAGEINRLERSIGDGVIQVTIEAIITKPTAPANTYVISESNENINGLDTFTISYVAAKDGTGLTNANGAEKEIFEYQKLVPFIFPGVVDLMDAGGNVFPAVRSPVESNVLADVITYYQTSSSIDPADFTKENALGLWNPSEWCQKIAHIDAFYNEDTNQVEPAYFNAQGMRGCRTRLSFDISGDLNVLSSTAFDYSNMGVEKTLSRLTLEETTELRNGRSIYREEREYAYDTTALLVIFSNGVISFHDGLRAEGKFIIECSWNGSQWELIVDHRIVDQQSTIATNTGTGTFLYVYSIAAKSYLNPYTNKTQVVNSNTVVFTSSNGANTPDQANFPSSLNVSAVSNEETIGGISIDSATLSYSGGQQALVQGFGGWIEGRKAPVNANGQISIKGGPPNPLGKKYVLDVNLKKAFTDVNGTDVYQKQIVVATCNPA